MKKSLITMICGVFLCTASSAMATSVYYEATNVEGVAEINYGTSLGINDAPIFSFSALSGDTPQYDFSSFQPGEYTLSFSLDGFWADVNKKNIFTLPDYSYTSNSFVLSSLPHLSGTSGQLSWDIDLNCGGSVSYDFGTSGAYTNASVNGMLALYDNHFSGDANGVMDANIGWDTLRVELNNTEPVPEPATMLLFGTGLLGLVGYNRKRLAAKK